MGDSSSLPSGHEAKADLSVSRHPRVRFATPSALHTAEPSQQCSTGDGVKQMLLPRVSGDARAQECQHRGHLHPARAVLCLDAHLHISVWWTVGLR